MSGGRDIIAGYQELAGGTLSLRDYLKGFCQPLVFASFAFDDPLPASVEIPLQTVSAWRRAIQRTSGITASSQHKPAITK
jgi:hypothetical protein